MLSEPNISYKPFWGICRPLNSWRANSPNPIQIYCALLFGVGYFLCCKHSFTRYIINSECKGNSYEKTINAVNAYACSYGLDTGIDCRNIQY